MNVNNMVDALQKGDFIVVWYGETDDPRNRTVKTVYSDVQVNGSDAHPHVEVWGRADRKFGFEKRPEDDETYVWLYKTTPSRKGGPRFRAYAPVRRLIIDRRTG
ncbi:hypothetical protein [Haladaptatus sp. NG-WS-4]